jgi:hypothetical protein
MIMAKTKAQLNREIAEALAGRKRGSTSPHKRRHATVKKPHASWHGPTGTRRPDGKCSGCGASGFTYSNGNEISAAGVRGYRCMTCGTIKPERASASATGRGASTRHHATVKKPSAKGKTTTKIDVDRLVKMFGLPEWNDIDERNHHYYWEAARGAEDEEAAEQAARDELYHKWYDAVTGVAERLFGEHGLELDPAGKGDRPYEFRIVPKKDWKDAADKIRTTMGGVGYFDFNTLREFLDSGPYTAQQAVLSHLGTISDYPSVYGGSSARSMYDQSMR